MTAHEIRVEPFGHSFECAEDETILAAALRQQLFLRYGCRHGGCGTCKVQLLDGDVQAAESAFALSPMERDADTILACQSRPVEDCVINVADMSLDEDEFLAGATEQIYQTVVERVEILTPDIRRLTLRLGEADELPFVAGQFVNVVCPPSGEERSYSLANPPDQKDRLVLICKILPGGVFSTFLESGPAPGTELEVRGPFGLLRVRLSHRRILMVCGGSGLSPLLSMLAELASRQEERPVALFFGARKMCDLYELDRISELGKQLQDFHFYPVLSDEQPKGWHGMTGLVTEALENWRSSFEGFDAYLCGPPGMISVTSDMLIQKGIRQQNIYFDAFVPTGN